MFPWGKPINCRPVIYCILLLSIIIITGCAVPRVLGLWSRPYSPLPTDLTRPLSPDEMFVILNKRAPDFDNLWSEMKIDIRGQSRKERTNCRATFLYTPPDKARLRGYKTGLPTTIFEILAVNEAVFFHLNLDKELYIGTLQEWHNSPIIFSDIDLRDMGYLLMPLRILRSALEEGRYRIDTSPQNFYVVTTLQPVDNIHFADSLRIFVRKKDLLVQSIDIITHTGQKRAVIQYGGYDIYPEQTVLPREATIILQNPETKIMLRSIQYKVNPSFSVEVYEPPDYRGLRRKPLRDFWEKKVEE